MTSEVSTNGEPPNLWAAIDRKGWRGVPCLVDRIATEQDVKEGRATFYLNNTDGPA
jgi:hypothetical protein